MSNRKRLPRLDRRAPDHGHTLGRHRQPTRSPSGVVWLPRHAWVKFLTTGAFGSAALLALSACAASAATSSAAAATPALSLAADTQSTPAGTSQPSPIVVPASPSPAPTLSGVLFKPPLPADVQPPPAPAQPSPMFVLSNGKITSDPSLAAAAAAQPVPTTLPPGTVIYAPAPPESQPIASPRSPTGGIPVTFFITDVDVVGGTISYTTDPSGQTDGSLTVGILLGFGTNVGMRAGTPAPANNLDISLPITAVTGSVTTTATADITNSSVTFSATGDIVTWPVGVWPVSVTQGTTGLSGGLNATINGDGSWSLSPRAVLWSTSNPQATFGITVTAALPANFFTAAVQTMNNEAATEAGLVPPQPEALPPAPQISALTAGGPTLDQLTTPITPSQGFPDPAVTDTSSGLASLAQQPPSAGPSVQDVMNTLPQAPDTAVVPSGSLPPGTVYTGDPTNPFINIFQAQPPPPPPESAPSNPAQAAIEPQGQSASTAVAASPETSTPANNDGSDTAAAPTAGSPGLVPAAQPAATTAQPATQPAATTQPQAAPTQPAATAQQAAPTGQQTSAPAASAGDPSEPTVNTSQPATTQPQTSIVTAGDPSEPAANTSQPAIAPPPAVQPPQQVVQNTGDGDMTSVLAVAPATATV
jgi:hypothetical protein